MAKEPQKNNSTMIIIAVIGVVGTVVAATIGAIGNYNTEKLRQEVGLTRIALASSPTLSTIALSDKFDNSTGSYDTNLWACDNNCSIEYLFLRDGVLVLNRRNGSNQETTGLISRSKWDYHNLLSLEGKFQITSNANRGEVGWIGVAGGVVGCGFFGKENPYVLCTVGPSVDGKYEYHTNQLPIKFDTWYSIKFEFDQTSGVIRFYLDNTLAGEHAPTNYPDKVQVNLGLWSPDTSSYDYIYIDDILLTLNK